MKSYLTSITRISAYVVATIIILTAVLVSVSRVVTPALDQHRTEIEQWASALLQKPVTIHKVRLSWYKYQPEITLKQVTVLDQATKNPILQVNKVNVFISIPQSLWQRKIVPAGIMISGVGINVHQNAAGELSLQGFPAIGGFNNEPYKMESRFTDILGWLSLQPSLLLRDVDVRYSGFSGEKKFISLYEFNLENSAAEHFIYGKAVLHQKISTEVTIAAQWSGATVDLNKIKANVYMYVSGFSLSQWLKGFVWHDWQVNQGIVSSKIWAEWNNGSWQKIQSNFQAYGLSLLSQKDKGIHKINRLSGIVGWKKDGNKQELAGEDILIDWPAHLWPVTGFDVLLTSNEQHELVPTSIKLAFIDLLDVKRMIISDKIADTKVFQDQSLRDLFTNLHVEGQLQNTSIEFPKVWNDWQHIAIKSSFKHLGILPWKKLPGVSNLSGSLQWNDSKGDLSINSQQTVVKYDDLFATPLKLGQVTGTAQIKTDPNKIWTLSIPSLQIANDDLKIKLNGSMISQKNALPLADMKADFAVPQAKHITEYLPLKIFDADLVKWLHAAFVKGETQAGHAELRGPLADFPFDKGNGFFKISTKVKNIDLKYAPDWPQMNDINGTLDFTGRQMLIDVTNASMMGVPLVNVHADIPYLGDGKPQILKVNSGEIKTDFSQGMHIVHSSPLEKTIGNMFSDVQLKGPIGLKLALTVPLSNPDDTQVLGTIDMFSDVMDMSAWKLNIDNLNGQVRFTEKTTDAENITGTIFNKPLKFNLRTIEKNKDLSIVRADFGSRLAINDLDEWLKLPLHNYAQGEADVTGDMEFSMKQPMQLTLHSNLAGVGLSSLEQYSKKPDDVRDFTADLIINKDNGPIQLDLNYDKVASSLQLERDGEKFNLSKGEFNIPSLHVFGQTLNQVHLDLATIRNRWSVKVASKEIVGQLNIPSTLTPQDTINAKFQKMKLRANPDGEISKPAIEIKSLPAISFIANNFSYNNISLGEVAFTTKPTKDGLSITNLRVMSPRLILQSDGDWVEENNGYVTYLKGSASSPRISDLLGNFGYDVHNFISSTGTVHFNLRWKNAPYAPAVDSLNGTASLAMGQGRIVDIGQGASAKMGIGQLLNIFSLQSIPRRLTFDFSDVFTKGYSFDSVKGDFTFVNGDAKTNNFYFNGTVAKVGINGVIGLKAKDFDFILVVTPYLTSSVPAAAAIVTAVGIINPLVGLGAVAANYVIGSQVSKATTYYYEVNGPWSNPNWKSVKVFKS